MKVTAISPNANLQRYGYKHTQLIEGKLSRNLRNLIKAAIARYQYHFYYMIKYDYSKLRQFDAIILTTPPNMPNYGEDVTKPPYYIIPYHDSIMSVLTEINLKKDAEVFIIATDKHHYDTKHTNTVLKKVEKELKCYGCSVD